MRSSSTDSFAATASSAESFSFGSRTRRKAFSVASFVIGRPSTTAQVSAVTAGSLGVFAELQADARNAAASAPVRSVGVVICMSREAYLSERLPGQASAVPVAGRAQNTNFIPI